MRTIAATFRERARHTPTATALTFRNECITYADLDARAAAVARQLEAHGIGRGSIVAIAMARSPELVTTLLALSLRRAAYVGIDRTWPHVRIAGVLSDAQPALLVVDAADADQGWRFEGPTIRLPLPDGSPSDSFGDRATDADVDDLFCLAYTSGSTGRPKGVMVPLGSVVNKLEWMWRTYPFADSDVGFLHRSYTAAGLPMDAFAALLRGGPTVISPVEDNRDINATIDVARRAAVTHCGGSVGFWRAVIERIERQPDLWPTLRLARSSGEPLPPDLVARWQRVCPQARLLNMYGATECSGSMVCDTSVFDAAGALRVPIGAPIPGVEVVVVDDRLRPVPPGVKGELCIGGASLALGYWRDPDLTRARFVELPDRRGARWFATGDVGVARPDGQHEILGRRDLQVSVRGFRVEIEEVEAALMACAGVRAAGVRADHDGDGVRLVAYVTAARELAGPDIRRAVAERLPSYMVPADIVVLDELPHTPAGKIDRNAVAELAIPAAPAAPAETRPQTPTEIAVAQVWSEVLGFADICRDDNFFDLGGHSLTATRIASRLEETFTLPVPVGMLFDYPFVSELAAEIDRLRSATAAGVSGGAVRAGAGELA